MNQAEQGPILAPLMGHCSVAGALYAPVGSAGEYFLLFFDLMPMDMPFPCVVVRHCTIRYV
jgi:hypothetical protein